MNQKSVGLTLRATILALALILVASTPGLPLLDGVAYAQSAAPALTAGATPDGASVQLSWTEVTNADSYQLYKQDRSVGTWSDPMSMSGTDYTDSAVTAGKTYGYYVEAIVGGAGGNWSNYREVTVPGGTPATRAPTARPDLDADADGLTAIDLSWTAVSDADHYDLWRWNHSTDNWSRNVGGNLTGTSYKDTGLASGAQYSYSIRAVNAGGNGPWSSEGDEGYATVTLDAATIVPVLTLMHLEREVVDLRGRRWRITPNTTCNV